MQSNDDTMILLGHDDAAVVFFPGKDIRGYIPEEKDNINLQHDPAGRVAIVLCLFSGDPKMEMILSQIEAVIMEKIERDPDSVRRTSDERKNRVSSAVKKIRIFFHTKIRGGIGKGAPGQ